VRGDAPTKHRAQPNDTTSLAGFDWRSLGSYPRAIHVWVPPSRPAAIAAALVRAAPLSDQVRRRCGVPLESTLLWEGLITPAVIPASVQENLLFSDELLQRYPYVAF
jgi:hypothetical protein